LQKAIELRPIYPDGLNKLGVLDIRTGNLAEAKAVLDECVRVAPKFDVAYLNLAKVYAATGKTEQARSLLRWFLEAHPGNAAALHALQELNR
jgi:hypothetical protein